MKAQQQMNAGAAYKAHIKEKDEPQLVDVTVPSGFVFKFEKPSKFSMLFAAGQLPLSATNKAVGDWKQDGLMEEGEDAPEDQAQMIKAAFMIRDKVLRLSHTPKLVVGAAGSDNELSTDDVADEDLDYLFKWVAAGGDKSSMLSTFPARSQPDSLASASRQKQRNKAEPVSGN